MALVITATDVTKTGLAAPTLSSVGAETTLKLLLDGRSMLMINNGDASGITATVKAQVRAPGDAAITDGDVAVSIGATSEKWIGPPQTAYYDDNGYMTVELSAVTSVTAGAIRLPEALP